MLLTSPGHLDLSTITGTYTTDERKIHSSPASPYLRTNVSCNLSNNVTGSTEILVCEQNGNNNLTQILNLRYINQHHCLYRKNRPSHYVISPNYMKGLNEIIACRLKLTQMI